MTPDSAAISVIVGSAAWWGYTYAGYPLALGALAWRRKPPTLPERAAQRGEWPMITICMVAYNAEATIADTIERTLALDYPADRRHILIASDASTDRTDEIIRSFADRGVELLRVDARCGKTACENWAAYHVRGDLVINTDVGVVVERGALKRLVRAFDDPAVALASGRDVSVAPRSTSAASAGTRSESSYVSYEMLLRELETRVGGIVGASGCLYAVRADIQLAWLPGGLCRDFAAALIVRRRQLRAVSVADAVCYVPRSTDLSGEFRRKLRTCTRGIATLVHFGGLLNPNRYGAFAWMLSSHKLMRWLAPWLLLPVAGALAMLAIDSLWARIAAAALLVGALAGLAGVTLAKGTGSVARACAAASYIAAANLAVVGAWISVLCGHNPPVWEPTRRMADATSRGH